MVQDSFLFWSDATCSGEGSMLEHTAVLGEEPLKMFWAGAENKSYPDAAFGEIVEVTKKDFAVKCGDGILRIKEVQARGGKKMAADAYLRGHEMQTGILLG